MTDFRALCVELYDQAIYLGSLPYEQDLGFELMHRARTALAQPEPEGPTDEELLSLDQLRDAWNAHADAANGWDELGADEIVWWAQRQALARWGHPAPQPVADGEVAELAAKLRRLAPQNPLGLADPTILRAADLLERQHPQPIPVSERLPGPGDLDAEGRVWAHMPDLGTAPSWRLIDPREIGPYQTHWLPAHALPLPAEMTQ